MTPRASGSCADLPIAKMDADEVEIDEALVRLLLRWMLVSRGASALGGLGLGFMVVSLGLGGRRERNDDSSL